jgi:tRNA (cmo5U34)-methyltransferase
VSKTHSPRTAEYRGSYVPGYEALLRMTAQVLGEFAPEDGTVLVLGAGGGLEIEALSQASPGWRYVAVDPDKGMLDAARERVNGIAHKPRITWVDGYIFDAPHDLVCDGATCLLTLHFVPDDGAKLATLRAVRERLRSDARFVLVDISLDTSAPDAEQWLRRYYRFGVDGGIDPENMASAISEIRDHTNVDAVAPQRTEALLREAGFAKSELFYCASAWRGWIAYA